MKTIWGVVKLGLLVYACLWLLSRTVGGLPIPGLGNSGGTAMTLPTGS
jgi:hypothetical protein